MQLFMVQTEYFYSIINSANMNLKRRLFIYNGVRDKMHLLDKKAVVTYWVGSISQMFLACIIIFILKFNEIQYPEVLNILFLIVGGSSSAVWGIIVSIKYKYSRSGIEILKEFFNIKQSLLCYCIVIVFIIIVFGTQIFRGNVLDNVYWYTFLILFIQSIVFGGIEEIGWRYTWQPIIEKSISFEMACICTFGSWSLWHYMYFYLTNSLSMINHVSFLIGLLGSCFILGAIYKISKSLWLCVLYHCILNVLSQTLIANTLKIVIICNSICIILSILIVRKYNMHASR